MQAGQAQASDQANWADLQRQAPDLAKAGRRLLYRGTDTACAFLATVDTQGGPRVHPVFPVVTTTDVWLFIVNMSPKYRDLTRNPRIALHSFPTDAGGEEFHLRGQAIEVADADTKAEIVASTDRRQGAHDFEVLFRCLFGSALFVHWDNWGTPEAWPSYSIWKAGAHEATKGDG